MVTSTSRPQPGRPMLHVEPTKVRKAAIVLACAEPGAVYERVAAELGVTKMTVLKWRKRFGGERLDGLADGERAGPPKADLVLTETERAQLMRCSRRAKSAQALAVRARIVLA
jgi:transposase-like protein